jgi:hypothetical protein
MENYSTPYAAFFKRIMCSVPGIPRYVFRVAISNNRIKSIENNTVTFLYKDRQRKTEKTMTLDAMEFIRRFLQHVLPKGFMKIRHYGPLIIDP